MHLRQGTRFYQQRQPRAYTTLVCCRQNVLVKLLISDGSAGVQSWNNNNQKLTFGLAVRVALWVVSALYKDTLQLAALVVGSFAPLCLKDAPFCPRVGCTAGLHHCPVCSQLSCVFWLWSVRRTCLCIQSHIAWHISSNCEQLFVVDTGSCTELSNRSYRAVHLGRSRCRMYAVDL